METTIYPIFLSTQLTRNPSLPHSFESCPRPHTVLDTFIPIPKITMLSFHFHTPPPKWPILCWVGR